jgi:hypothetical protein
MTTSLPFERYSTEGNSLDAVVYLWEEELLNYRGTYYKLRADVRNFYKMEKGIPDNAVLKNVELRCSEETFERIEVKFSTPSFPIDITHVCRLHFIPEDELKTELCAMFQRHGSELKEEMQQLKQAMECFKRVKAIMEKNRQELEGFCPQLDLRELNVNFDTAISHFPCNAYDHSEPLYDKLESLVESISRDASDLEKVTEISRKRKNPDLF